MDGASSCFRRQQPLTHDLAPHYPALRRIRRREALLASPLYAQIGAEIERVTAGIERGDHAAPLQREGEPVRVVAWNVQRGARLDALRSALQTHPELQRADVLLLSEVDLGMARSGNRNVARELAEALGMSYVFGTSYLVLEDDFGENPEGGQNTLALAGCAVLSRLPIGRVENVDLPELRDKFSSSEKRLGRKRALLCELAGGPHGWWVAAVHLDSNASPRQRAQQLTALLQRADQLNADRLLVGGDFNTTTYDASGPLGLMRDLLHKFFTLGFRGTVDNYMTPDRRYEEPVFEALRAHGLSVDGAFNDRACGTTHYDLNSPYAIAKVREKVGGLLTSWLRRRLRPWGGVVPARLDWMAGRGLVPQRAAVVRIGVPGEPPPVSDHEAILVDVI